MVEGQRADHDAGGFGAARVATDLTAADLRAALAAGWRDFLAHPVFGLFFAAFYVAGGLAMGRTLLAAEQQWWLIPLMAGFPLLAPFSAVGLYAVSRARAAGERPRWGAVLGALRGRDDDQLLLMGGVIFVAFGFWLIIAHGLFAIFLGGAGLASVIAGVLSGLALADLNVAAMLVVGSIIGGLFAAMFFVATVTSLPMLIDRDVDFISAIITSLSVVRANRRVMLGWAAVIAAALVLAMLPLFIGLFIALPVLGHATWHLYRRAVPG